MSEALECLDKLEECAEGMKDLPKSNWIDLAENEAELDLKIMDWVETIKFELFKGNQALLKSQEQEKVLEIIKEKEVDIVSLKNALSVEQYNSFISFRINYMGYMKLTQEEFDLLKRYFN